MKTPSRPSLSRHFLRSLPLVLALGGTLPGYGQALTNVLDSNPYVPPGYNPTPPQPVRPLNAPTPPQNYEFLGYSKEDGVYFFNLRNVRSNQTLWVSKSTPDPTVSIVNWNLDNPDSATVTVNTGGANGQGGPGGNRGNGGAGQTLTLKKPDPRPMAALPAGQVTIVLSSDTARGGRRGAGNPGGIQAPDAGNFAPANGQRGNGNAAGQQLAQNARGANGNGNVNGANQQGNQGNQQGQQGGRQGNQGNQGGQAGNFGAQGQQGGRQGGNQATGFGNTNTFGNTGTGNTNAFGNTNTGIGNGSGLGTPTTYNNTAPTTDTTQRRRIVQPGG